ncbi:MAG: acyl-CoA dehydrogenase family protein [Pseudomonadales bacterium]|jgi:alkylation response protein AidB-like acyl-CoA dehydrogenase|nr:acyl-CoA dehydrogenase family protein [Pseudomonadales bacterium]MDG1443629.1 acyl-CoA dehydrogenase family protein [Pseudomonadales bacterium]
MNSTSAELLSFANEWSGKLPALSDTFETQRRLSPDVAKAFAEGGVFHMLVPSEYGGLEVHPKVFTQVLRCLSEGDGSAGWNAMIGSTTGVLSASLPADFAKEIYGDKPGVLTVGVTAPLGKAEIVDGGYRVTGRWPFGSGSQNADWVSGGCFLFENGEQVMGKHGPESHLMMFKADQVNIEDTWHVAGLKGTGSNHFNVKDVFVPKGRSVLLGKRTLIQKPLYQFPLLGLLALGVSSVSLGIGFKALKVFMELAGVKSPTGSNRKLIDRPAVQSEVAKSIADLESSEAYMHACIDDAWDVAISGEKLSLDIKSKLRLAAVNATHKSVAAVDRLYQLGGGTSIYESNELQRCFRDIHITTQHIMVASPIYEVVGKVQLGLDPRQPI